MRWPEDSALPGRRLFIRKLSQFSNTSPTRLPSPPISDCTHVAPRANCMAAEGM